MRVACVTLALAASAAAFVPAPVAVRSSSGMTMSAAPESRRAVLETFAAAAATAAIALPQLAFADGAVSDATVQRAKGIYGGKVLDLADAVKSGNFAAVEGGKGSITLLCSGGFGQASKADKAKAKQLKNAIFAAIDAKDAASLQKNYAELIALARIPATTAAGGDTQGYSSDFDWKNRTSKGTIYVR